MVMPLSSALGACFSLSPCFPEANLGAALASAAASPEAAGFSASSSESEESPEEEPSFFASAGAASALAGGAGVASIAPPRIIAPFGKLCF